MEDSNSNNDPSQANEIDTNPIDVVGVVNQQPAPVSDFSPQEQQPVVMAPQPQSTNIEQPQIQQPQLEPLTPVQAQAVNLAAAQVVNQSDIVSPEEILAAQIKEVEGKKPKKISKKMAIIISVAAVLFLVGGSVSAYTFIYSNPSKVLYDAISGLLISDAYQVTSTTTLSIDTDVDSEVMYVSPTSIKKVTVKSTITNSPSQLVEVSVEMSLNDKTYTIGAKGMYVDNGDLYYRLDDILSTMEKAIGDQTIPQGVKDKIANLEGKWVKYSVDDMAKQSEEYAKGYKCMFDTYKKVNKDKAFQKETVSIYGTSPFLLIDEKDVQSKDGKFGYKVSIDTTLLVRYGRAFAKTDASQEISKCFDDSDFDVSDSDEFDEAEAIEALEPLKKANIMIWVDQWTHKLKSVDVSYKDNKFNTSVNVNNNNIVTVDDKLTVFAPDQFVSFSDWQNDLEALFNEFYGL